MTAIRDGNLETPLDLPADADLHQTAEQLNDIQAGLHRALAEQTRSERMKVELISNVSHDLKTPLTSVLSCAVSCNQSLAAILTCQMCDTLYPSREDLALALENTVIVLAPLIPWGIAGAVPVATIGAPMVCMLYAFYLYLLPVWNLFTAFYHEWPGTSVPCRDA